MGIGKRIKEARTALRLTQEELASRLGITKGAIANYENETSHPKEPIMYKLIDVLGVDANYLFQDMVVIQKKVDTLTLSEVDHIKKYRSLSESGKEMVDMVLQKEYEREETIQKPVEPSHYMSVAAYDGNGVERIEITPEQAAKEMESRSAIRIRTKNGL